MSQSKFRCEPFISRQQYSSRPASSSEPQPSKYSPESHTSGTVAQALYAATSEPKDGIRYTCFDCETDLPPYHFAPIEAWWGKTYPPARTCVACRVHKQTSGLAAVLKGKKEARALNEDEKRQIVDSQRTAVTLWHRNLFKNIGFFVPHSSVVAVSKSIEDHPVIASMGESNPTSMSDETTKRNGRTKDKDRAHLSPSASWSKDKTGGKIPQPPMRAAAKKASRSLSFIYRTDHSEKGNDDGDQNSSQNIRQNGKQNSNQDKDKDKDKEELQELKATLKQVMAEQNELYDKVLRHINTARDEHESLRRLHLNKSDMYDEGKWSMVNAVSKEQANTKITLDQMRRNFERAKEVLQQGILKPEKGR